MNERHKMKEYDDFQEQYRQRSDQKGWSMADEVEAAKRFWDFYTDLTKYGQERLDGNDDNPLLTHKLLGKAKGALENTWRTLAFVSHDRRKYITGWKKFRMDSSEWSDWHEEWEKSIYRQAIADERSREARKQSQRAIKAAAQEAA